MRLGFNLFDKSNWNAIINFNMFMYVNDWNNAIKLILYDTLRNKHFEPKWK
jgi:hypothetical protein